MNYIGVTEAAAKVGKTRAWIHQLIQAKRIPGAIFIGKRGTGTNGRTWLIPRRFKILPCR